MLVDSTQDACFASSILQFSISHPYLCYHEWVANVAGHLQGRQGSWHLQLQCCSTMANLEGLQGVPLVQVDDASNEQDGWVAIAGCIRKPLGQGRQHSILQQD
jgi:hypothetical protein